MNHEEGTVVIGGNVQCFNATVDFWSYPAGGNPSKVLANVVPPPGQPEGASVSIAPWFHRLCPSARLGDREAVGHS